MDNLLDKHNNHLFLEKSADNNKSFIKAVMMLVDKFESLVTIDSKFTEEDIKLLTRLVKEEVDINIETISEEYHSPITYPIAVIKDSPDTDAAKAFEDFLFTEEAQNILKKYGYKSVE